MSKDFLHILWARGKVGSDRPTHEKLWACVIRQCSYKHLQDYDLPSALGREVDLTVATTRLIAGGIFDRFPAVNIGMVHFGGGIAAVKDRLVGKGYRFGTLKKSFGEYYNMVYFDMAGFEGGVAALNCALQGIRPERLVFASDYPQDFTGVNTDTGKGMNGLKNYIETIRNLPAGPKI